MCFFKKFPLILVLIFMGELGLRKSRWMRLDNFPRVKAVTNPPPHTHLLAIDILRHIESST